MTIIKDTLAMHTSYKEPESGRKSKKGNIYFSYQNPPGEEIEFVLKEIKVPL